MSAFPSTAQPTLGIGRLGAALVALALVIVLSIALAFGQFAATQPRTGAAAGAAPAQWDHGTSSGEMDNAGTLGPAQWDHGTSSGGLDNAGPSTGPGFSTRMTTAK